MFALQFAFGEAPKRRWSQSVGVFSKLVSAFFGVARQGSTRFGFVRHTLRHAKTSWLLLHASLLSQLGSLLNLKELAITETWTTRLPTELGALASLQRMDLSGDQKVSTKLPGQTRQAGQVGMD